MAKAKAGSGVLLVKRPLPEKRERPAPKPLGRLVLEMPASLRRFFRSLPKIGELQMRRDRTKARIRKRHGHKPRPKLSPERKAIRAERRAKRTQRRAA